MISMFGKNHLLAHVYIFSERDISPGHMAASSLGKVVLET